MPCWQQRVEGPQWVQERYGPPIRELRRRRPDLLWPARCQRWGDGAPPTRRSSATGRLRRWSPCSQALGRSPARGRHPRPPSSAVVSRCPVRPHGWERSRGQARGPHGRPPRLGGRRHPGARGGARARWCPTAGRPPAPERPRPPPSRPGLRPVAAPAGQAPTPAGGTRQPPPGVPRGGARALGAGPRRGVGRPATPPRGAWARAPLPLVPAGPPDGAPEARPPRPPGTARRRGPGAAPRRRTHHRSGRQPGSRGAVTPAPPPCARGPPRPRLATAGSVLPQRPVRPRRPVTAPGAVRTVQGCPIQG